MSKKKRQFVTIIFLIVILAVSGVGYVLLSKHQAKKDKQEAEGTESEESISLYSMKAEEITQIHFINSTHEMTLVKEGEIWKDSADPDFPVNQEYAQTMAEEAGEMTATQLVVRDPEDLSQYQLDYPQYTVELTDQSGETKKLMIGVESVAAGGRYAYVDQADQIYVIASSVTDYFDYTRNEMMELPEAPAITAEYVTGYKVKPAKGKSFTAKYDETGAEFADMDGWDIIGAYQTAVPGSSDALQTLFAGLNNMEATEGVEYRATDKLLKQYGLAKPTYIIDVDYDTVEEDDTAEDSTEEQEEKEEIRTPHHYQISVGSLNDQEDHYYVSIDGSDGIYLMSSETIDALVEINAFDYVYKQMHKPVMEQLQDIRFAYQGQEHEIKVTKKEVENGISEDGSTVYDYTILLDGKTELDEYDFQEVYSSVFGSLVYSREQDNTIKGQGQKAQTFMKIVTDKRTIDLQFLPYDGNNFYRVEQDGVCNFLADINVVESAMKKLLEVETVEEAKAKETQEPSGE